MPVPLIPERPSSISFSVCPYLPSLVGLQGRRSQPGGRSLFCVPPPLVFQWDHPDQGEVVCRGRSPTSGQLLVWLFWQDP